MSIKDPISGLINKFVFELRKISVKGVTIMVNVKVAWQASPAVEAVVGYNVYQDGNKMNPTPVTGVEFTINNVSPGTHGYSAAPINILGEGPYSDPIVVVVPSGLPSKLVNVTVSVSLAVS